MQVLKTKPPSTTPNESKDRWRTPDNDRQPILTLVEQAFGDVIWLDPTADTAKSVRAFNHYTENDNCLTRNWSGNQTAFMNPPFSQPLPFVAKLVQEYEAGHIQQAIALLKAGCLNNKGTGVVIKRSVSAICMWGGSAGRIAFVNAEGVPQRGADFDCCLIYYGQRIKEFGQVFSPYGSIFVPYR